MNRQRIEDSATQVQRKIWRNRHNLWPNQSIDPIDMLNPSVACQLIGVVYEEHTNLGTFGYKGKQFEIAGLIDRQVQKIAVSNSFSQEVVRFTAAHEVGHWLLHPNEVMHRDRPLNPWDNQKQTRALEEREADYFAACFLMPKNFLKMHFELRFLTTPFHFNDHTTFLLGSADDLTALTWSEHDSLDRALALAKATKFNGQYFASLAEQFKVSNQAMAIRLEELGLIKWP